MFDASRLTPAQRPERDLPGRWGIFCDDRQRWIDVVFASEKEARHAIEILQRARSS